MRKECVKYEFHNVAKQILQSTRHELWLTIAVMHNVNFVECRTDLIFHISHNSHLIRTLHPLLNSFGHIMWNSDFTHFAIAFFITEKVMTKYNAIWCFRMENEIIYAFDSTYFSNECTIQLSDPFDTAERRKWNERLNYSNWRHLRF